MKKPRQLTLEELAIWHESNRDTTSLHQPVAPQTILTEPRHAAPSSTVNDTSRERAARPDMVALPVLTRREASKRFKSHPVVEATLDLHGLTKLEAYAHVCRFITRHYRAGHRHVTIITGKGRGKEVGILRSHLPDWLNEPALRPLISTITQARPEKGGEGVTHVLLKRG